MMTDSKLMMTDNSIVNDPGLPYLRETEAAMRLTKEKAAENRDAILAAAARLFRERGVESVSVAEIMSAAGFTHGGFYNHFSSKEALAAEACGAAFDQRALFALDAAGEPKPLGRTVRQYLSLEHRDEPSGCPTAALVVDAARQGGEVQAAYVEGIRDVLDALARAKAGGKPTRAERDRAARTLSELVGALLIARAVRDEDPELSDAVLAASRKGLSDEAG